MQDQEPQSQDWQPPQQATSQAPYAPVAAEPQPTTDAPVNSESPAESLPKDDASTSVVASESSEQEPTEPISTTENTEPKTPETNDAEVVDKTDQLETAESGDLRDDEILVRWQSPEYLHSDRTPLWYGILALITIALMAVAIFVFNSISFAILLPVMAVALVIYAHRPPALVDYIVSRKGLHVNDHLFSYDQFKSFGVVSREDINYVALIPRKRFQLGQHIYFPRDIGEQLVDMLAARLPMKDVKPDLVDRILLKLHL